MTDVLSKERRFLIYMIIRRACLNTPATRHNTATPAIRHNTVTPNSRHNTERCSVHARTQLVIIKTRRELLISSQTLCLTKALLDYAHKLQDKFKVVIKLEDKSMMLNSLAMGPET